jgi:hypothetical protein
MEATFAGQTPGQQAAEVCMVKPKDLRDAKRLARELQIVDVDLSPVVLAMVVKAAQLAKALGVSRADAWVMLMKEREGLMAYVHQKTSPKPPAPDDAKLPTVYVIPDDQARPAADTQQAIVEIIEDFSKPED